MFISNLKAKNNSNTSINKKNKNVKKKKKKKQLSEDQKNKFNILLVATFFTGVLLIFSSYAWFYASLDVKIDFFKMEVSDEVGLFISLDGINYANTVNISQDTIIDDLSDIYPNNTNQWPSNGLTAVSSNGIRDNNSYNFDMYMGYGGPPRSESETQAGSNYVDIINYKPDLGDFFQDDEDCELAEDGTCKEKTNYLSTSLINEGKPSTLNYYIAFDFFLKNVTGSPYSDNLYLDEGTTVYYNDDKHDDSDGIINSLRFGFVKIGSTSNRADAKTIQNLSCNNNCQMIIYEPNSTNHSVKSIERIKKYGVTLVNGEYLPTYAVINNGIYLQPASGLPGSGIALDMEHFALQKTITDADFDTPIFEVPNGVTKVRAYIWVEGQDVDSLETRSTGGIISIVINLIKDLAGYYK